MQWENDGRELRGKGRGRTGIDGRRLHYLAIELYNKMS